MMPAPTANIDSKKLKGMKTVPKPWIRASNATFPSLEFKCLHCLQTDRLQISDVFM
jgi:hypothetical protein